MFYYHDRYSKFHINDPVKMQKLYADMSALWVNKKLYDDLEDHKKGACAHFVVPIFTTFISVALIFSCETKK